MTILVVMLIAYWCCVVDCRNENITDRFPRIQLPKNRQQKLLSFNTEDDGDVTVELAFNVPFLRIPVKKSLDMASGAVANINIGAVVLAVAMVALTVFLVPGLLILFTKSNTDHSYRSEVAWRAISALDVDFTENGLHPSSCLQRMLCWTVKTAARNVAEGRGTSSDKIIDGIATNDWLTHILDSTSVLDAVRTGLEKKNCSKEYGRCRVNQKNIETLVYEFIGNSVVKEE